MAQMTESMAQAILAGDGITRSDVEQLCHAFLRHSSTADRLTAELERSRKEVEVLREELAQAADDIESWAAYAAPYFHQKHDLAGCVEKYRALSAGRNDGNA